jgi:hypothetical protein
VFEVASNIESQEPLERQSMNKICQKEKRNEIENNLGVDKEIVYTTI